MTSGQHVMDRIRSLVRRFSLVERADVACCGMTVAQAATLDALRATDGLRLGSLGQRLGISNSTMTRNLDRLKQKGLVTTAPDPADKRAVVVRLTATGREAADRVAAIESQFAQSIADALGESGVEQTVEALDRLLEVVRVASDACCPGAFDHLMPTTQEPKGETP